MEYKQQGNYMANTKYIAVNCSAETKNKIDEYRKNHNLAQFEVLDYMVKLLEDSERNGELSTGEALILEQLEKQTTFIHEFSEKLYALVARNFITLVMKGKQYNQDEALNMANEQAHSVVSSILYELEKENPAANVSSAPEVASAKSEAKTDKQSKGTMDNPTRSLFGFNVDEKGEDDASDDKDDDPVLRDPRLDYDKLPTEPEEKPAAPKSKPLPFNANSGAFNTTPINAEPESEGNED